MKYILFIHHLGKTISAACRRRSPTKSVDDANRVIDIASQPGADEETEYDASGNATDSAVGLSALL